MDNECGSSSRGGMAAASGVVSRKHRELRSWVEETSRCGGNSSVGNSGEVEVCKLNCVGMRGMVPLFKVCMRIGV